MRARVADRRAGPVVVPAGERGLDVVLVARGEAEPDHVDSQVLAFARAPPRAAAPDRARRSCSRQNLGERGLREGDRRPWKSCTARLSLRAIGVFHGSQVLRRRASPKPGMRLTAMTTAKVMTSMMRPSTEMAPRSPALVEVEDQHRDHLGLRREQHDGGGQFADDADEDEAPGRDHAGAQQRRGDVAQRPQARRAEDAAGILELGMHGAERRLQLLIGGRQRDGDEGDQQDPQRAVEHERRPRVAQEQADAEHDAGDRDRRGGEKAERAMAPDGAPRRQIGDHQRQDRADGRRRRRRARRCSSPRAWWRTARRTRSGCCAA